MSVTRHVPTYTDPIADRARRVIAYATKGHRPSSRLIAGAVDDTYERLARDLLLSTVDKAIRYDLSAAEHELEVAHMLRSAALRAAEDLHRKRTQGV